VWRDGAALALEVSDTGHIREPLVGRLPPAPGQLGGRGLWLVNELCDLVQLRSSESGTVVRVSLMPR
jgi:anti-sigma regulatory factor (Ser/Thr protein kinase)